jgi:hypothetical protein
MLGSSDSGDEMPEFPGAASKYAFCAFAVPSMNVDFRGFRSSSSSRSGYKRKELALDRAKNPTDKKVKKSRHGQVDDAGAERLVSSVYVPNHKTGFWPDPSF